MFASALGLFSLLVIGDVIPGYFANEVLPPGYPPHSLIIRAYPGIEDIRSDLYEVYQEPYNYVSPFLIQKVLIS